MAAPNDMQTVVDISARIREANAELRTAKESHASAAYAHAMNRDDAQTQQTVIDHKRSIDLLEGELFGLDAAMGEARRRDRLAGLQASHADLREQQQEAFDAFDAMQPAFARTDAAIHELGASWKALQAAEAEAKHCQRTCARMPHGMHVYPDTFNTKGLVDALLWLEIGDGWKLARSDSVMDATGRISRKRPAELVAIHVQQARMKVTEGIEEKVQALTAQWEAGEAAVS